MEWMNMNYQFLYWVPKLHKNPYKQRYMAGSSKCSIKPLSLLLTKILTAAKAYCATTYARSGVNQIWILKNSKELLANLKAHNFSQIHSVKSTTFRPFTPPFLMKNQNLDFLILLITVSLTKLGKENIHNFVISYQKQHFVKYHSDSAHKYSEFEIKKMLEFFIDNISVVVGSQVFHQSDGIPMCTNCAPLLANLFLYSYYMRRNYSKAST
jgi:hypothetical protein